MMVDAITSDAAGKNSEIDSLTRQVKALTGAVDFWNRWMLAGLVAAAIAALWLVLTTRLTIVRQKQLSILQGQLDASKDQQLERDLSVARVEASNADERAAKLEVEALSLKRELISQGPRVNLLYGKTAERLIAGLKPFAGQKVEIRYSVASFNQYHIDNDTMGVATRFQYLLDKAGWSVSPLLIANMNGTAVWVSISSKSPETTVKSAKVLLSLLRGVPLKVNDEPTISDDPRPPQPEIFGPNGKVELGPFTPDTVVITVLSHP